MRALSRKPVWKRVGIVAAIVFGMAGLLREETVMANDNKNTTESFSPRLKTPRIAPIAKEGRTEAQQKMLASRPDYNLYTTLAHHVELYNRWSPLGQYLLNGSTLPPRDREIIMLRMGWLCQSEYEWSQHARIAKADVKMSDEEIRRIAIGPQAKEWSAFDRTLLTMVDELRYDTKISDKTWNELRAKYSLEETIDAFYTAAQYQLVSMVLNSTGIQLDAVLKERIPTDLPLPPLAGLPTSPRLATPRVKPIALSAMTAEQREMVAGQIRDGKLPNLYGTMINHPGLYKPRLTFGSYIQRDSSLSPKSRELLIMRTGWNIKAEYEWAHHVSYAKDAGLTDAEIARIAEGPKAKGWSEEHAALLQAADELRREAFISDATWKTLAKYYQPKQLVEIIYTVGGYTMTGLAINSLGIQIEEGYPRFPKL
jgi:4-carboxymuconolactone decarboxylase